MSQPYPSTTESKSFVIGGLILDFEGYVAKLGERPVSFTALEWRLLKYLCDRRGEVISRDELLKNVWHLPPSTKTRAVDIAIHKLRQKLEQGKDAPRYLITIYGKGYQLTRDVEAPRQHSPVYQTLGRSLVA